MIRTLRRNKKSPDQRKKNSSVSENPKLVTVGAGRTFFCQTEYHVVNLSNVLLLMALENLLFHKLANLATTVMQTPARHRINSVSVAS